MAVVATRTLATGRAEPRTSEGPGGLGIMRSLRKLRFQHCSSNHFPRPSSNHEQLDEAAKVTRELLVAASVHVFSAAISQPPPPGKDNRLIQHALPCFASRRGFCRGCLGAQTEGAAARPGADGERGRGAAR